MTGNRSVVLSDSTAADWSPGCITTIQLRAGRQIILLCLHSDTTDAFTAVVTPGIPPPPPPPPPAIQLLSPASIIHYDLHCSSRLRRAAAYRSRSACRPVSSACRQTDRQSDRQTGRQSGGPPVLWAPHILSSCWGEEKGRKEGSPTASPLPPPSGSMCFSFCLSVSVLWFTSAHTHRQDQDGGRGRGREVMEERRRKGGAGEWTNGVQREGLVRGQTPAVVGGVTASRWLRRGGGRMEETPLRRKLLLWRC